jgi:xylulokinase
VSRDVVIGVDVGSQGTCAQALDAGGALLAAHYHAHDLAYPRPGWAEQDPGQWLEALAATVEGVVDEIGAERIAALAFGSQLDGLVAIDGDGRPLRPALIWMDRRAAAECRDAAERLDPSELRRVGGCNLDAGHVAAKMAWLRRHDPDCDRRARWLVLPGSFVALHASGALAVDPSNASSTMLLDTATLDWSEPACAAFGIDPSRLAPVRRSDSVLGEVSPWLRDAAGLDRATLVVLGCGDEMAATLGAGVVEPGSVCDVIGTAEPVCAVVDAPVHDASGVAELHPHAVPGGWLLENPGWLSGGAYRWLRDTVGVPEARRAASNGHDVWELLNDLAEQAPPACDGLLWLPALAGAMTPEWNAHARATWFGLTPAHGREHLVRAVVEGNAYALRDVLEAIRAAGQPVREVVAVAGGARGRLLRQVRADVTAVPVSRPEDVETTARGAAMLAAAGVGLHPSAAAAAAHMAGPRVEPAEPRPVCVAAYDRSYGRYRALYDCVRPLFASGWG